MAGLTLLVPMVLVLAVVVFYGVVALVIRREEIRGSLFDPVARTGLRGLVRELMDFRVMDPSATVQSELRNIGGQGGAEAADRGGELSVTD